MSFQQPPPRRRPFPQDAPVPPPYGRPPGNPSPSGRDVPGRDVRHAGPVQHVWPDAEPEPSGRPPAPPGSGTGRAVGVVVAVVTAVVLAGATVLVVVQQDEGGDGTGETGEAYRLTTPGRVAQGDYVRDTERSGPRDDALVARGTAFSATYDGYNGTLVFRGAHGTINDPASAVGKLLSEAGLEDVTTADGAPAGYPVDVWKCGAQEAGASEQRPFCAWGDDTTAGLVMWGPPRPSKGGTDPDYVRAPSPDMWSKTVQGFRDEVRVVK